MLDLGNNFVERLENVSHLTQLEELWVRLSWLNTPSPQYSRLVIDQRQQDHDSTGRRAAAQTYPDP